MEAQGHILNQPAGIVMWLVKATGHLRVPSERCAGTAWHLVCSIVTEEYKSFQSDFLWVCVKSTIKRCEWLAGKKKWDQATHTVSAYVSTVCVYGVLIKALFSHPCWYVIGQLCVCLCLCASTGNKTISRSDQETVKYKGAVRPTPSHKEPKCARLWMVWISVHINWYLYQCESPVPLKVAEGG